MNLDHAIILKNETEHLPIESNWPIYPPQLFVDNPEFEWNSEGADWDEIMFSDDYVKELQFDLNYEYNRLPTLEEALKDVVFLEPNLPLKEVPCEEPAVILQQEPESYTESDLSSDDPSNLATLIEENYQRLRERQDQIDLGTYERVGPGRNRKYSHKKSEELSQLVETELRKNLLKIVSNKRCKARKDALITIATRALKKICYFLVVKTTAKNMYKRNEVSKFIVAFSESHASLLFSTNNKSCSEIVRSFVEFIVIYFPESKARLIIDILKKQDKIDHDYLWKQLIILETRDNTSKKNIKEWADNSSVLRKIFEIALEILQESAFSRNKSADHLKSCFGHFLSLEQ